MALNVLIYVYNEGLNRFHSSPPIVRSARLLGVREQTRIASRAATLKNCAKRILVTHLVCFRFVRLVRFRLKSRAAKSTRREIDLATAKKRSRGSPSLTRTEGATVAYKSTKKESPLRMCYRWPSRCQTSSSAVSGIIALIVWFRSLSTFALGKRRSIGEQDRKGWTIDFVQHHRARSWIHSLLSTFGHTCETWQ